jgi:hypothetical protein
MKEVPFDLFSPPGCNPRCDIGLELHRTISSKHVERYHLESRRCSVAPASRSNRQSHVEFGSGHRYVPLGARFACCHTLFSALGKQNAQRHKMPKVFVARDSSSPLPFGPTAKAMRSSRERGASVPPTLPRWTRYPSASCNSPTSKPLNGS